VDNTLEDIIIKNLVQNEIFCRKTLPHLKPEYFEGHYRSVYGLILNFIGKYNKLPNGSVLDIEFRNSDAANKSDANEVYRCIKEIDIPLEVELEWLIDNTEKWCKDRAVHLAVMEAITIIDGKDKTKGEGLIPEILAKALSVTFDTNVGHDYIANAEERYAFYHKTEDKIPFDLEMLNTITNGGVPRKTLSMLMSGTGGGKSLAMCHFAAANLAQGRNVLYITMEMSEEKISERIDANLLDVRIDQLKELSKTSFTSKIKGVSNRTKGTLIVKEYPTAAAHVGHFRALLLELKMKKKFVPDVIYIDYLNICASSRMKGLGGSINSYGLIKSVAEEIRGLAVEFNVSIWSATQVNRDGYNTSDIDITNVSESMGISHTVDLFLVLISTEQLDKSNQIMVKQLKNRYNDPSKHKRFTLGIDRSKMRLYDIADPMVNIVVDGASGANSPEVSTPFNSGKKHYNVSGLKV
jgi:archaellum biogenesis ATPase FlaH